MSENTMEQKHTNNLVAIASVFGLFVLIGVVVLFVRGGRSPSDSVVSPTASSNTKEVLNDDMNLLIDSPAVAGPEIPSPDASATASTDAFAADPSQESDPTPTPSSPTGEDLAPNYLDYSEATLADTLTKNGKALLFFHANWCPTCRMTEKSLIERGSELPNDIIVVKIDFDSQRELKRKYGVVKQHTFVLVNKLGTETAKWIGGDMDEILANIDKAL